MISKNTKNKTLQFVHNSITYFSRNSQFFLPTREDYSDNKIDAPLFHSALQEETLYLLSDDSIWGICSSDNDTKTATKEKLMRVNNNKNKPNPETKKTKPITYRVTQKS